MASYEVQWRAEGTLWVDASSLARAETKAETALHEIQRMGLKGAYDVSVDDVTLEIEKGED